MSSPYELLNRVPNPDFGSGCYRRSIRLLGLQGKVIAELEDCNHGFRSTVHHNGEAVTDIEPEALRYPLTSCPGALEPIRELVGTPLAMDTRSIIHRVDPRANCTHLYDLSVLAIHHALRGDSERRYDVTVPDEKDGPVEATVALNGKTLLTWKIHNWTIQDSGPLQGKPLGRGFSEWASKLLDGDAREAAFVLQKGYFVSGARRFDISKLAGTPVTDATGMACYSYRPGIIENAVRTADSTRDFTDTPEQLLKFR